VRSGARLRAQGLLIEDAGQVKAKAHVAEVELGRLDEALAARGGEGRQEGHQERQLE
jgi:hypothetical protein